MTRLFNQVIRSHDRMKQLHNQLTPYREILAKAREKRFREWEPKLRYLAKQFNTGALRLPKDPVFRASLFRMQEQNGVIDMSTVDSNCRMLARAVWDAKHVKHQAVENKH